MSARRTVVGLAAVTALALTGCGGTDTVGTGTEPPAATTGEQPTAAETDGLVIDVTIEGGEVSPTNERFQGRVGEPIVIRVDSDAADELHVHSIPEYTFAVAPAANQTFEFTVDVPGQVDIELHGLHRTIGTVQVRQ